MPDLKTNPLATGINIPGIHQIETWANSDQMKKFRIAIDAAMNSAESSLELIQSVLILLI